MQVNTLPKTGEVQGVRPKTTRAMKIERRHSQILPSCEEGPGLPGALHLEARDDLLQPIADDSNGEAGGLEAVAMMQLEFRRLHMEHVVPPRDDGWNRETAIGRQFRNLAFPRSGEHVANLANPVFDGIVYVLELHPGHVGGNLHGCGAAAAENAGSA